MAPVIPKTKPAEPKTETKPVETKTLQDAQPQMQPPQDPTSKGEVAIVQPNERSIIRQISARYHMEPLAFQTAVMETCFPGTDVQKKPTPAEFAAFLLIAYEHGLNPIRREIYGFKAKSGAIVPVVGVDGWSNIINQHPQMDGIEFDEHFSEGQSPATDVPYAITCRIYRKDRRHFIAVTEYLTECKKNTDPWNNWPRRMLRHKALIQCARVAFGFTGIYDPDEAERMGLDVSAMTDVTPARGALARQNGGGATSAPRIVQATQEAAGAPAKPSEGAEGSASPAQDTLAEPSPHEGEGRDPPLQGELIPPENSKPSMPPVTDEGKFILWLDATFAAIKGGEGASDEFSMLWDDKVLPRLEDAPTSVVEAADMLQRKHSRRLGLS
jgi:phage recombination protein Bet